MKTLLCSAALLVFVVASVPLSFGNAPKQAACKLGDKTVVRIPAGKQFQEKCEYLGGVYIEF